MPRRDFRPSAQGFNPGNSPPARSALKGRKIQSFNPTNGVRRMVEIYAFAALFLRPFRARHRGWQYPGLKPWAEGHSPFGATLWLDRDASIPFRFSTPVQEHLVAVALFSDRFTEREIWKL